MKVNVVYTTQLKTALGLASEIVEIVAPLTVGQLIQHLSQRHGESFNKLALAENGQLNPSILICVGNECLGSDLSAQIEDAEEITLLSPVSGG